MAPALEALFDHGDAEFHAALIDLGRRGCECVQRLFRDILPDAATTALAAPAGEGWRERARAR